MRQRNALGIVCLIALAAGFALAGTATSNMSTSADVSNNCIISAGALSFGAYDPVSANASSELDQTATLTVTCTNGAAANITLDQGTNAATGSTDSAPLRRLKLDASNFLSYSLWQDSGHATVWGNTTSSPNTSESYTGTGTSGTVTVYGKIAGGQTTVHAGSYADTVVVTVSF